MFSHLETEHDRRRPCASWRGLATYGIAACLLTAGLFAGAPPAAAQTAQPQQALQAPSPPTAPVGSDVRAQLARYGTFVQHPKYGEVWVPSVTPQGWHPYPPCGWVRTRKYGWYYNDKTPWGQIVHHYGRWVFTEDMGWIWTPGAEWSPGWVVWRTSPQYVGWAPMLPEQDVQVVSADAFNNSEQWLFMDTAKFASGCQATQVMAGARIFPLLEQTTYVTRFEYVDGAAIFVLPAYVVGPFVDIDVVFAPWSIDAFTQLVVDWNFIFHHFTKVQVATGCTYSQPN